MKVWVISHAYAAAVNHDKLAALAELPGIDLTLLAPSVWRTPFGPVRLPRSPTAAYRIIPARVLMNGRGGAYLYRDGWGELRRARPAIVHVEVEPWSLAALQCVLAVRFARLVFFTWENRAGPRRLLSRLIERLVLSRAAFLIAGNRGAEARLLRRGVARGRITVLPQFGVDPARYAAGDGARVRARLALEPPVVGYAGRLVLEKGLDILLDAVAPIDARVLLVGAGPARAELERRVTAWPRGKAVFAGAVDHRDIPDYLAALDVLILPSRTADTWAEQFGHVLIEAMAAGVPVIGSSSGAIPEVIGDAGLVFPEGDVTALRGEIGRILGDEPRRKALIARGRERVEVHYTQTVIARAQYDLYGRLLTKLRDTGTGG